MSNDPFGKRISRLMLSIIAGQFKKCGATQCKPAVKHSKGGIVNLAKRLEVSLYTQSKSKEEYVDPCKLSQRVRELAKDSTAHHAKSSSSEM